ncbi:unnamed protein product [Durusdinium trenchii]|uniref:RRM domain-containing protein n=1 Tax=Durusdinium trenchii TaxID=1381693 RepID=A0ABP0SVQ2_9DINO
MASRAAKVLMKHFPQTWVAEKDRAGLPARIQKILSRFGALLGEPEIFDGRGGDDVTAIACFETQQAAEAAVKTLLGADMRTSAEKKATGNRPPLESERFWVEIQPAKTFSTAVPPRAQPLQALGTELPEPAIPDESYILVRGFPMTWMEPQVKYLFVVFGGTSSVRMVPDAEFGHAARVILKDIGAMERAATSLNQTDVGHLAGISHA